MTFLLKEEEINGCPLNPHSLNFCPSKTCGVGIKISPQEPFDSHKLTPSIRLAKSQVHE